jgi:PIN domain nuclease of toxin-antitoxin system
MNYIADTHTCIWFFNDDVNLSPKAKTIIEISLSMKLKRCGEEYE